MNVTMTASGAGRPDRAAARNGKKTPSPAGGYITMNFTDADLRILIKFISELTGKNFLVDPRVKGKVTILSPKKVTIDEAYRVFLSVLEINGYTAVPAGRIIKILPSAAARAKGIQTRRGTAPPSKEDKVITQLVPLTHADADGLAKLLRPLVPKTGLMIAYRATNTLIIIDTLSNVNRLVRIIGELDVAVEREEIRVFFLKNARAADLAPMLLKLLQKRRGKQASTDLLKIMPDKRTNALVLLAAPRAAEKIEKLIRELDREQARPRENIHIYSLKNAVAEDIAKVLREIPGKSTGGPQGKGAGDLGQRPHIRGQGHQQPGDHRGTGRIPGPGGEHPETGHPPDHGLRGGPYHGGLHHPFPGPGGGVARGQRVQRRFCRG